MKPALEQVLLWLIDLLGVAFCLYVFAEHADATEIRAAAGIGVWLALTRCIRVSASAH